MREGLRREFFSAEPTRYIGIDDAVELLQRREDRRLRFRHKVDRLVVTLKMGWNRLPELWYLAKHPTLFMPQVRSTARALAEAIEPRIAADQIRVLYWYGHMRSSQSACRKRQQWRREERGRG